MNIASKLVAALAFCGLAMGATIATAGHHEDAEMKQGDIVHVAAGKVDAADVVTLTEATTLEGSTVLISASEAGVTINDANVVATDIEASNGVIHVIDTVLIPAS